MIFAETSATHFYYFSSEKSYLCLPVGGHKKRPNYKSMIKFFRRIRRKLLEEGNLNRYLIYAIGEIFLVVIGILIALQINNWNEKRKDRIDEVQYLIRLKSDLVNDTIYFSTQIEESKTFISNASEFIKQAHQVQKNLDEFTELMSLFSARSEEFVVQNSTYLELYNSGYLNIFQNWDIKDALTKKYREYEVIRLKIHDYNTYTVRLLSSLNFNFWKPHKLWRDMLYTREMIDDTDWQYINDPISKEFKQVENMVSQYLGKHIEHMGYYISQLSDTKDLILQIDVELDSK